MSDTLMTIIGIFVAVVLMLLFPLVEVAGKNDEIAQTAIQVAISDFVNNVASEGKITEFEYNKLVQKLYATGNSYDVIIEARILDENPEKRTITSGALKPTESQYYSVYTNTILDGIAENGEYLLKKDDYVLVTVKNTNITIGTQLKNIFYRFIGKDNYTIGANSSALVINTGVVAKEDLKITTTPALDGIQWALSMSKVSYKKQDMQPFNVIYLMDYSGSMGKRNIKIMHDILINQIKTLKGFTEKNNNLAFTVSIIGLGGSAGELARIDITNTYDISEIETKLNGVYDNWIDPPSDGAGGLRIVGDLSVKGISGTFGNEYNDSYNNGNFWNNIFNPYNNIWGFSNQDSIIEAFRTTSPIGRNSAGAYEKRPKPTVTYIPGKGNYYIGSKTSYWAGARVTNEVLTRINQNNRDNYIVFMADGAEEDPIFKDAGRFSFKEEFDEVKDKVKGIYTVGYSTKVNNWSYLEWCAKGVSKGGFYKANSGNISNVFEEIMSSISKTEEGVELYDKTILADIDPAKKLEIKIINGNDVISDYVDITNSDFIQYNNGYFYLYTNRLRKHYEAELQLTSENEQELKVHIRYYTKDN